MGAVPKPLMPGQPFPRLTLPGYPGEVQIGDNFLEELELALFERGHWCVACRRHLAQVAGAIDEFRRRSVAIVAVVHEPIADLRTGALGANYPFPIGVDAGLEESEKLGIAGLDEYGKRTIRPSAVLIHADGSIAFSYVGDDSLDRLSVPSVLLAIDRLT